MDMDNLIPLKSNPSPELNKKKLQDLRSMAD